MKYIIVFLFIPFITFSQVSFNELMTISSVENFKKVVIENDYEFNHKNENQLLVYGYNIERDTINGNKSTRWGYYNIKDDSFTFSFARKSILSLLGVEDDKSKSPYDIIVKDIKRKCKYYKILKYNEVDYVSYSCPESSYKGKIGFVVSEGTGFIHHFSKN